MKKPKTKNLKPIDIDGHGKYRCPNCGIDHWISFKEASVKNFILVCDCEATFSPKRIKDIKIIFAKKKIKTEQPIKKENSSEKNIPKNKELQTKPILIPETTLSKSINMLQGFGFTKDESEKMIKEAYASNPTENIVLLVKRAIAKLGGFNG